MLLGGFTQQAFGHHKFHIALGDNDLREAVLHAAHGVRGEGETLTIEDGLLNASYEAQTQILTGFPELAQEVQIQYELLVLAGAQIVQQFVHHQQQTLIRERGVEGGHHLLETALIGDHLVSGRKLIGHSHACQAICQFSRENVPQGHGGCADLRAHHPEFAGDALRRLRCLGVIEAVRQALPLSQR